MIGLDSSIGEVMLTQSSSVLLNRSYLANYLETVFLPHIFISTDFSRLCPVVLFCYLETVFLPLYIDQTVPLS